MTRSHIKYKIKIILKMNVLWLLFSLNFRKTFSSWRSWSGCVRRRRASHPCQWRTSSPAWWTTGWSTRTRSAHPSTSGPSLVRPVRMWGCFNKHDKAILKNCWFAVMQLRIFTTYFYNFYARLGRAYYCRSRTYL